MPHPRLPADWAQIRPGLSYVDTAEVETTGHCTAATSEDNIQTQFM